MTRRMRRKRAVKELEKGQQEGGEMGRIPPLS
jgi:hypothetical protein